MKKFLIAQAILGIAVVLLSFSAQATTFYRWNDGRSEVLKLIPEEKATEFNQASWKMWSPPSHELYWLRWIGLGIAGISIFGLWKDRSIGHPRPANSPSES